MSRLLLAELLKLRTTWTPYGLGLAMAAIVALSVVGLLASAPDNALARNEGVVDALRAAPASTIFALIVGILVVTGEFRHGTITQTFLVTPVRERVVAAKVVASALVGVLLAAIALGVALAIAVPWLAARGAEPTLADREVATSVLGIFAGTVLWGALGAAIGATVRNQILAITGALVWFFVLETLIRAFYGNVARYLPGEALNALTRIETEDVLSQPGAALVLAGYVVALAAVGSAFSMHRDVT